MRKIAGVVCAIVAVPVAVVTILFAAGAADPEADSAAWGLSIGTILGLAATTALLWPAAAELRQSSTPAGGWRGRRPLTWWLVVAVAFGIVIAELLSSALDELELDALFLTAAAALLVGLTLLTVESTLWGALAAATLALGVAALCSREGPYDPTLGYWLPRALVLGAGLAVIAAILSRSTGRSRERRAR